MGVIYEARDPQSQAGEDYRMNWFTNSFIVTFCRQVAPELMGKIICVDYAAGFAEGLYAEDAKTLGMRILESINSDEVIREFILAHKVDFSLQPLHCHPCSGTGLSQGEKINTDELCLKCNGTGLMFNYETSLPGIIERIKRFACFLIQSGGFIQTW